jgi:hypothetical protein
MKECGEVEGQVHTFLTSALDGDEWSEITVKTWTWLLSRTGKYGSPAVLSIKQSCHHSMLTILETENAKHTRYVLHIQQNSVNPARMELGKCRFIEYSGSPDGTYTDLSFYK